jgi:hypothetical protein
VASVTVAVTANRVPSVRLTLSTSARGSGWRGVDEQMDVGTLRAANVVRRSRHRRCRHQAITRDADRTGRRSGRAPHVRQPVLKTRGDRDRDDAQEIASTQAAPGSGTSMSITIDVICTPVLAFPAR